MSVLAANDAGEPVFSMASGAGAISGWRHFGTFLVSLSLNDVWYLLYSADCGMDNAVCRAA